MPDRPVIQKLRYQCSDGSILVFQLRGPHLRRCRGEAANRAWHCWRHASFSPTQFSTPQHSTTAALQRPNMRLAQTVASECLRSGEAEDDDPSRTNPSAKSRPANDHPFAGRVCGATPFLPRSASLTVPINRGATRRITLKVGKSVASEELIHLIARRSDGSVYFR